MSSICLLYVLTIDLPFNDVYKLSTLFLATLMLTGPYSSGAFDGIGSWKCLSTISHLASPRYNTLLYYIDSSTGIFKIPSSWISRRLFILFSKTVDDTKFAVIRRPAGEAAEVQFNAHPIIV